MLDLKMVMLIAVVAILGFGAFWGFIRKLNKTLVRLITLLLSFGGAFALTKLFGGSIGRYIISLVQPLLGESVEEILSQPEMAHVADALCEMLAAPILFLLAYMVFKILTWIVYKIFVIIFRVKGPKLFGRLTGAAAGVLCGAVGLVVFVTVTFGYMTLLNDVLAQLPTEQEQQGPTVFEQMMEAPVAKQTYELVGQHVFRALTTVDFEDDEIVLEEEVSAITDILKDALLLVEGDSEEFGEQEAQAVKKMSQDIGKSKIVSTVAASFLSNASQSWLDGEDVLGMSKPDMGEYVQGIADAFLSVFVTSNADNLSQDMGTFADAFGVLVESEIFVTGSDNADFVKKIVSGGVVNRLYAVLDANPRMNPVKTAIRDTGVRVMMDQLGAPAELRETHAEMLENMVDTLKSATKDDGTIDQEVLSAGIHEVLETHEIPVSEEASQLVAEAAAEFLTAEEIQSLSIEELADKLAERFTASGNSLPIEFPR